MPDCIVVRFGGNNLKEPPVISTLMKLLSKPGKRHILIVSATGTLQDILTKGMKTLCSAGCDPNVFFAGLNDELDKIKSRYSIQHTDLVQSFSERLEMLLKGIHFTGDFSLALRDQVLSYAEKITAALLCGILTKNGISSAVVLPEEIGLQVSEEYGNASILTEESRKNVINGISGQVSLIPGSYGITQQGKVARIGHRAADYTAAALAAIFDVKKLELWQIGKPFKTADEQFVSGTSYIESLTYAEASELSYFNHSGIHPRIVDPLIGKQIPVYVYELKNGQKILRTKINTQSIIAPRTVKSVASTDDIAILKLNGPGVGFKPGILAKVTGAFSDQHINIRSVITAQTSINMIVDKTSIQQVRQICSELKLSSVNQTEIAEQVSLIAVVGHGMQSNHGISAQLFTAVAKNKINVLLSGSGASDLVSYLVVNEKDKIKAIREIHKTFFN